MAPLMNLVLAHGIAQRLHDDIQKIASERFVSVLLNSKIDTDGNVGFISSEGNLQNTLSALRSPTCG